MYQGGLSYMRYSVSDTAEHGDYTAGPKIITDQTRQAMKQILADIRSPALMPRGGLTRMPTAVPGSTIAAKSPHSQIEQVGKELRKMMPWMNPVERDYARGRRSMQVREAVTPLQQ
jgi:ketol-acid reductoisomerase